MTQHQKNTYNNAPIEQPYVRIHPILQTKRVLDPKSELYIHQKDLRKRFNLTEKSKWTDYRHSDHYQNFLDPFYYLLKSWEPPRFFAYLSLKLTVSDPKIGHTYTANIEAHLADTYRCMPVNDSIKAHRKAKIKIMRINSFTSQDNKIYFSVQAQYVSDEIEQQPTNFPSFHGDLTVATYDNKGSSSICKLYWPKSTDQISFIYCPKYRRKPCVINAVWNLGDLHRKLQYSLPEEHFGNFINCKNPNFQIAYESRQGASYNDLIQLFNYKAAPQRLELQYMFAKHYYCRSGKYYKQGDSRVALRVRILRLLCPDDKSEIAAIGRICQSDIFQQKTETLSSANTTLPELDTRFDLENEAHLFAPGGLITIIHYGKNRASHPACIAHIIGPKTDAIGAFPVIPV